MESVLQVLISQFGSDAMKRISEQVGGEDQQVQKAVGMLLPILIGALNRNASSSSGAEALGDALQRDHDGSILENLTQALGQPETVEDGSAILGHVFGERRAGLVNSVGRATNLDANQVGQISATLAPLVLGALGRRQREQRLDSKGLSALLQQERKSVEQKSSGLAALLDMDGDGDVTEEVVSLGANLLGGLMSESR